MFLLSGDSRVNVVPSLTTYHNMFVVEHNRIARAIRAQFPQYSDEELFQLTRKIIIAIMQKITYDEFLPAFLSPDALSKFRLTSATPFVYDGSLDPTIANAFGIAYRYTHLFSTLKQVLHISTIQVSILFHIFWPVYYFRYDFTLYHCRLFIDFLNVCT